MKTISLRLSDELHERLELACSNKQEFLSAILTDALDRDVIVIAGKIRHPGRVPVVQRDDSRRTEE